MKIIYHHRTLGDGAEGIHVEEMVSAFREIGHEVRIVAPIGDKTNITTNRGSKLSKLKSLLPGLFFELAELAYNVYGYYLLRKAIKKERPDFIYDRYITFNASIILIGLRYNIPVFLEVNAPLALERSEQADERLCLRKLAFAIEKWVASNSFKTIVVSTPLKKYLVSQGVQTDKIEVLPNGANTKKFKPKEKNRTLLKKHGLDNKIIIGFVGILRPWHGLDILLEAFSNVNKKYGDTRLLIVGDGPIRHEFERQIAIVGLDDKVLITGRVPHAKVADYISLFDIAVSPKATFYASPMKILEYMALGKAVVAPQTENIQDIIEDGVDGVLFLDGDSSSLCERINAMIDDRLQISRIGKVAYEKIIRERNWSTMAVAICEMLSSRK